jgi:hypothetical protein
MLGLLVFVGRAGAQPLPAEGMPLPSVTGPLDVPGLAQAQAELAMPQRADARKDGQQVLPMPQRVEPFGPGFVRLPRLDGAPMVSAYQTLFDIKTSVRKSVL